MKKNMIMIKLIKSGFKLITFACMGAGAYIMIDGVRIIREIDSL